MSTRKRVALPTYSQGIKCPTCHCRDLRVYSTKREGARIKRYRVCRACGHSPIVTIEAVLAETK